MRRGIAFLVASAVILSACTNTSTFPGGSEYTPLVDMRGHSDITYREDLRECREYARQISVGQETVAGAAGGALLGTMIGAVAGALAGGRSWVGYGAARGAAYGGISGGVGAGANAWRDQAGVIRNCLAGRGYNVLR